MVARDRAPGSRIRSAVWAVVEPAVTKAGYDLEELHVSRAGSRHVVRITVGSEEGVGSGRIGEVSRIISTAIDEAEANGPELIRGAYVLEVSSPGVDRPLTLPRHWRRNRGRLVKVKVGDRAVTGRVTEADGSGVRLAVGPETIDASYGDLGPGKVQLEFNRLAELSDDDLAELTDDELTGDELTGDEFTDEEDDEEGYDDEPEGKP